MPIPKPKPNETKNEYIGKCISFLHHENANRPPDKKRTDDQIKAICIGEWGQHRQIHGQLVKTIQLQAPMKTKALGNALLIKGTLLRPGTFTGLDGEPTHYSERFIRKVRSSIIGKPIRFAHLISPGPLTAEIPQGETVGFWTKTLRNGKLDVLGYVFHPDAIKYVEKHPKLGLSMEAEVATTFNQSLGVEDAEDGILTGGVLIEDPACPTCTVVSAREINLERGNKERNTMTQNIDATKEPFLKFVEDKELATPTRAGFFTWVTSQLKEAGAPENIVTKVLKVLKKAIKTPYPYPTPTSKEQELLKSLGEVLKVKELSEYTDFMAECREGGKSMAECVAEWKEKHPETETEGQSPEDNGKGKTKKEQELEKTLSETKTELETMKKTLDLQLDDEITGLVGSIKEFEKEFDSDKFLEHIECKVLQKKMLQKYLGVLKKHVKPINLQVGDKAAKTKVLGITKDMFGENSMTFEDVFPEARAPEGD